MTFWTFGGPNTASHSPSVDGWRRMALMTTSFHTGWIVQSRSDNCGRLPGSCHIRATLITSWRQHLKCNYGTLISFFFCPSQCLITQRSQKPNKCGRFAGASIHHPSFRVIKWVYNVNAHFNLTLTFPTLQSYSGLTLVNDTWLNG